MAIQITNAAPSASELAQFYSEAGWVETPSIEEMQACVESTSSIWFSAMNGEKRCGIARVITDGARYAFIVDVIVSKSHQGQGIGDKIISEVVCYCREKEFASINLWPSEGLVPFYEKHGFYALGPQQPHMKLKDS